MRVVKKGSEPEWGVQCEECGTLISYYSADLKDYSPKAGFYYSLFQYINCPCCGRKIKVERNRKSGGWKTIVGGKQ